MYINITNAFCKTNYLAKSCRILADFGLRETGMETF